MRKYLASVRIVITSGIIYFISQAGIATILHPIGPKTFLALQLCFSKQFYLDTFEAWRAAGLMSAYKAHLYIDMFHPIWYALFLVSSLACVFNSRGISNKWNWVLALPIVSGISDELENFIQVLFLSGAQITQPLVILSSTFSLVKWTLALSTLVIILIGVSSPRRRGSIL